MKRFIFALLVLSFSTLLIADDIDIMGEYSGFRNGQKLYYEDGLVYMLDFYSLFIIDVTDPSSPDSVGGYRFDSYTLAIDIVEDWAYVTYGQKIGLLDISDPISPELISTYELGNYSYDLKVDGEYVYIANFTRAVILRHTISHEFEFVGEISPMSDSKAINYADDVAFVGKGESGMSCYNVATPSTPFIRSTVNTPGWALGIELLGDYAFIADGAIVGTPGQASLRIMDVRNPSMVSEVGYYISAGGNAANCFPVSHYVVLADGAAGVKILDVETPSSPELVASRNDLGFVFDVFFEDGYIYATGRNTFYVLYTELIDTTAPPPDTIPPLGSVILPISGSYSSCSNQAIKFYLHDNEEIDPSSIEVQINSAVYGIMDSRLSYSNDTLTFQPAYGWWLDGEDINFSLTQAADMEGNPAVGLPYSSGFTVDISFPVIESPDPEPNSETESNSPTITLSVYDELSGLDVTSLILNVQGISYNYPEGFSWEEGLLEYTPSAPFADNETVEVCLTQAWDTPDYCEPNSIPGDYCWEFVVNPDWVAESSVKPQEFKIVGAYPNPFNSQFTLEFTLDRVSRIKFDIYDINGLQVSTLYDKIFNPGTHHLIWDVENSEFLSTGIYFGILSTDQERLLQKILLIK
ncbi:hypothetical protein JXI42_09115 [bacterium]|nr:hypothetical protein [bacterium]